MINGSLGLCAAASDVLFNGPKRPKIIRIYVVGRYTDALLFFEEYYKVDKAEAIKYTRLK